MRVASATSQNSSQLIFFQFCIENDSFKILPPLRRSLPTHVSSALTLQISAFLVNDLIQSADVSADRRADNVCGDTVAGVDSASRAELDQSASHGIAAFCDSLDLEIIELIVVADDLLNSLESCVDRTVADADTANFLAVPSGDWLSP